MNQPDTYTHGHDESVLRSHTWRTVANSAPHLLDCLTPGSSLLDIGCGPGSLTIEFAERLSPGTVHGVDVGADVISTARAAAKPKQLSNLTFAVDDAYSLDLPDSSFDIVHAHQVLQHVSDPIALLREARRVCRSGGLIAVRDADYAAMSWYPELPALEAWRAGYRTVCHHNGAEPDAARHLLRWAAEAGFTDLEPSADTWCFATPADRSWWGSLWADRVLRSALATQAVDYGVATADELETWSAAWIEWSNDPHAWFLVPNGQLLIRNP